MRSHNERENCWLCFYAYDNCSEVLRKLGEESVAAYTPRVMTKYWQGDYKCNSKVEFLFRDYFFIKRNTYLAIKSRWLLAYLHDAARIVGSIDGKIIEQMKDCEIDGIFKVEDWLGVPTESINPSVGDIVRIVAPGDFFQVEGMCAEYFDAKNEVRVLLNARSKFSVLFPVSQVRIIDAYS